MNFYLKLLKILEPGQRRAAEILLFLMFIGMLLETMGIGLVIPAVAGLSNPELLRTYSEKIFSSEFISSLNDNQLLFFGLIFLVFAYLIKSLFLIFLSWYQTQFVFNVQKIISAKMFRGYIYQPYKFHLQRNSSELIRNVITEVQQCTLIVLASTQLLAECLVLVGVTILLLIVEPLGAAIIMSSLTITCLLIYRLTRQYMYKWGQARQFHEGERLRHLQQGFGGIKDAKLMGREQWFLTQYERDNAETSRVIQLRYFAQSLPRLLLEFLMVIVLVILILALVLQGLSISSIIATLAVFAAAAFRLMPSFNRMLSSINTIRYGHSVIETLFQEISSFDLVDSKDEIFPLQFKDQICLKNIVYAYEEGSRSALNNVSLNIKSGQSIGFIGESGAGKSTLIDLILGLISPTEGTFTIDKNSANENLKGWQRLIGYVPQVIYLNDDSLRKNIAFGLNEKDICEVQIQKAVKAAKLDEFISSLPEGLDTVVGEHGVRLSGGQRQRIGIARALYHNPSVLVLDEATSALDNESEQKVMSAINHLRNEITIIIIAHRLTTVADCDYLFQLEKGKIIKEGKPQDFFKQMILSKDQS